MKITLKRTNGEEIHSGEYASILECMKAALEMRANLSRVDLSRADLSRADLSRANLYGADLSGADLSGADLYRVDLSRADLSGANLSGADLYRADLSEADLSEANLSEADLSGANLSGADLSRADLSEADLSRANLYGADLSEADLSRANLSRANLYESAGSDLAIARTRILPEGSIVGWKKCQLGVIVKLLIPEAAKRSHAFGRKCRANFADVLEVIGSDFGMSTNDAKGPKIKYEAGKRATCDKWDEDWRNECSGGIHFYITRIEAENHC